MFAVAEVAVAIAIATALVAGSIAVHAETVICVWVGSFLEK